LAGGRVTKGRLESGRSARNGSQRLHDELGMWFARLGGENPESRFHVLQQEAIE
jgi:hypothetical protein